METQITPELYEQVKAMVLAEQQAAAKAKTAERAARAAERAARRRAIEEEYAKAQAMFEPTRRKYTPLLAERYKGTFASGGKSLCEIIDGRLDEAILIALRTLGYYNAIEAYRDNKADEANQVASEILDALLKQ